MQYLLFRLEAAESKVLGEHALVQGGLASPFCRTLDTALLQVFLMPGGTSAIDVSFSKSHPRVT